MSETLYTNLIPASAQNQFTEIEFVVNSILRRVETSSLVRVKAVNASGVAPIGTVTIEVLVQQITSEGKALDNPTIQDVPYFRLQGGSNAIIIDPKVGDIGIGLFCSRDISKVKSTKDKAMAGSFRSHSFSDAVYFGTVLKGDTPKQYVWIEDDNITILGTENVKVVAPHVNVQSQTSDVTASTSASLTTQTSTVNASSNVTLNTPTTRVGGVLVQTQTHGTGMSTFLGGFRMINGSIIIQNGNLEVINGDVIVDGISFKGHVHGNVMNGLGKTGVPEI